MTSELFCVRKGPLMPKTALPNDSSSRLSELWQQELLQSYSKVSELLNHGLMSPDESKKLDRLGEKFKVRITPYYAKLMRASPDCPIRKQALPSLDEEDPRLPLWASQLSQEIYGRPAPWHADAIGDIRKLEVPRLTHRYHSRAILHLSSMCAMYCRFCFRKSHLNDRDRTLYQGSLEPAFSYLQATPEIREVILTGGDPLSASDSALKGLFEQVSKISHIRTLRIHSRMAVTLPYRFTPQLLEILSQKWNFHIVLVSHFNHPAELTFEARSALTQLRHAGITLLNQSVLLNGVNNSVECLSTLFQGLYEVGVIPYYLHHPDWTPGTFHFRVSIEQGKKLLNQLQGRLTGPALPSYILDIPHGHGKISLMGSEIKKIQTITPAGESIQGAVYELTSPETREKKESKHRYLDLHPEFTPPAFVT